MLRAILLLCLSLLPHCFAVDVGRIQAVHVEGEVVHQYWGTVFRHNFIEEGKVKTIYVTAAHTLEQSEVVKVETTKGWVKAEVVKTDKLLDVAFVKFEGDLQSYDVKELSFVGSVLGQPVAVLPVKNGRVDGVNQGCSGGPLVGKDGAVLLLLVKINVTDKGAPTGVIYGPAIEIILQVKP